MARMCQAAKGTFQPNATSPVGGDRPRCTMQRYVRQSTVIAGPHRHGALSALSPATLSHKLTSRLAYESGTAVALLHDSRVLYESESFHPVLWPCGSSSPGHRLLSSSPIHIEPASSGSNTPKEDGDLLSRYAVLDAEVLLLHRIRSATYPRFHQGI